MATSKSFFGKRRGSTKNFTFAVFNGKQVTKEKAEQVKNPRTLAQMRNRMILTTSSAAYAAMKEIVDHSFQGYVYGLQNMSRFQSVNNKLLRANIGVVTSQFAYAYYGESKLLPGAYIVSEGSLAPINAGILSVATTTAGAVKVVLNHNLTAENYTADGVLNALGISAGEMITVLVVWRNATTGKYHFDFIRFKSIAAGNEVITSDNVASYFELESSAPCAFSTIGYTGTEFFFEAPGLAAKEKVGFAAIHSALRNGTWLRSSETLQWPNDFTFEPTADTAIATYPVGGSYVLNGGDAVDGYSEGSAQIAPPEP